MKTLTRWAALTFIVFLGFGTAHVASAFTYSPVRFEVQADPGKPIEKEMNLTNDTDEPITFYSVIKNFQAEGETGVPTPTEDKTGLAIWIKTAEQVTIPAKTTQLVPFQIYVPADAEAGGYFGMILWSTLPPTVNNGEVAIGVQSGPLVLLSVKGDIRIGGGITDFNTKENKTTFSALPIDFYFKFKNDGSDRVKPIGDIHIKNMFGMTTAEVVANKVEGNILPSGTRRFETQWKADSLKASTVSASEAFKTLSFLKKAGYEWRNFAVGRYIATLALTFGPNQLKDTRTISFWVFPWHLLLVLLVLIFLIYFIGRMFIRKYNAFIIGQATMALEHMHEQDAPTVERERNEVLDLKSVRHKPTTKRK